MTKVLFFYLCMYFLGWLVLCLTQTNPSFLCFGYAQKLSQDATLVKTPLGTEGVTQKSK